ncbi:MAG: autotransporter outer membrane beta-barrel domain-containing protein, partial [Pseudomonadota bacterium]
AATQTGAISVATLTALRQQSLTLENRLNPTVLFNFDVDGTATRRAVGDIDAFGAIEGGYYSSDTQQVTPGLTGQTQVIKLGADVAVASNATVGIGLSLDHGQVDFEGSRGGFDSRLIVGALFGQAALSRNFYVNAAAGGGLIDVYNIDRRFNLGPATESYDSETTGTYLFARGGGGAMFRPTEEFLLNPFAHFTHESVEIDGFTESSGAASLSFGDTEYTSNRLSGGLSVIYSPMAAPDWRFNLRGSLEHDLKDDELFVALGPDTSTLSSVSAPRPDQTWGYIQGSIVRTVGPASFLSMTVSGSVGLSGTTGLVGSIAYKIAF